MRKQKRGLLQRPVLKRRNSHTPVPEPLPQLPVTGAVIGYARVSTAEQNLDMQLKDLQRVPCDRIHSEKVSAVSSKRPELEKAMALLREGDTFVIWRLDRLARSLPDLLKRVKYIEDCGAKLRSLNENIDTNTAVGRLLFHVLGSLAQFERDLTQERIASGMKAARERGVRLGALPMFDAKTRKEMQKDRDGGMSIRSIAAKYKCSAGTVQNWTTAPVKRRKRR